MEEELVAIVEWRIDNFSCWNGAIHKKVIKSPETSQEPCFTVNLFPRGLRGKDEHMVVIIRCSEPTNLLGELSYIGSDGSLLCKQKVDLHEERDEQQVDSEEELDVLLELPPGPKFEEVVTRIRENEALHKDRLTLRFQLKADTKSVEYMRTKISAFRYTLKISPFILDHFKEHDSFSNLISYEERSYLALTFSKLECSKLELTLSPFNIAQQISVLTNMTVLNNEDVVRTEENEHIFTYYNEFEGYLSEESTEEIDEEEFRRRVEELENLPPFDYQKAFLEIAENEHLSLDDSEWIFSNSLTTEEVAKEGFSLILYIKIIFGKEFKNSGVYFHHRSYTSAVSVLPSNRFRPPTKSVSQKCLSTDFTCLYQDQDYSDFQLKCGGVSFPVHKAILSARSPVFKTMLSTDMRESVSGSVDIEDLDPSTLGLFLTYLYTGAVDEMQLESALKLYYAADKYQVPSLNNECAQFLRDNVSISNVCDILSLAGKHQDVRLTSVAHNFILKNYNEVLESKEWKSFMKSEPLLADETVTLFAEKKRVAETSIAT